RDRRAARRPAAPPRWRRRPHRRGRDGSVRTPYRPERRRPVNTHDCTGLRGCGSHPRWFVTRYGGAWGAYPPYAGVAPATVARGVEEAIRYATERARDYRLAAIQDGAA